jgi:hypothetical protein
MSGEDHLGLRPATNDGSAKRNDPL